MRSEASLYHKGEIQQRLKALRSEPATRPGPDLSPWRSAAAVLVAFDPAKLKPVGVAAETTSGLSLLPELVVATGLVTRDARMWTLPTTAERPNCGDSARRKRLPPRCLRIPSDYRFRSR